jgi:transposase
MSDPVPTGRPTKLNPERQEAIVSAIRAGNTRKAAAARGGIDYRCLLDWIQRGQAATSGPFFQFSQAFTRAEADAEARNVAVVQEAARPHDVTATSETVRTVLVKRRVVHPNGVVEETQVPVELRTLTTTTSREFDWRAAAWWLERRHDAGWRQRREIDVRQLPDAELLRLLEEGAGDGGDPEGAPSPNGGAPVGAGPVPLP